MRSKIPRTSRQNAAQSEFLSLRGQKDGKGTDLRKSESNGIKRRENAFDASIHSATDLFASDRFLTALCSAVRFFDSLRIWIPLFGMLAQYSGFAARAFIRYYSLCLRMDTEALGSVFFRFLFSVQSRGPKFTVSENRNEQHCSDSIIFHTCAFATTQKGAFFHFA